jgi:hypothetical protein
MIHHEVHEGHEDWINCLELRALRVLRGEMIDTAMKGQGDG